MTNIEDEFLGPFIYNSTIVCLNASRLMSYNKANFSPSISPLGERVALNLVTRISTIIETYHFQLRIMMTSFSVLRTLRMTWGQLSRVSGTYPSLS